jgi:hypothetical protein
MFLYHIPTVALSWSPGRSILSLLARVSERVPIFDRTNLLGICNPEFDNLANYKQILNQVQNDKDDKHLGVFFNRLPIDVCLYAPGQLSPPILAQMEL